MFEQITNFYEPLVIERVQDQLDGAPDITAAQLEDIACVALNQLPPRYVRNSVDLLAHLTEEEELRIHQDIDTAIFKAVDTIRRRKTEHD